jgi:hypothetical protein
MRGEETPKRLSMRRMPVFDSDYEAVEFMFTFKRDHAPVDQMICASRRAGQNKES